MQEFIELCRARKIEAAITYSRKNLAPWAATHLRELQQGMTLLAFGETAGIAAYRVSFQVETLLIGSKHTITRDGASYAISSERHSYPSMAYRPNPSSPCRPLLGWRRYGYLPVVPDRIPLPPLKNRWQKDHLLLASVCFAIGTPRRLW
jgi:hypothetical protein